MPLRYSQRAENVGRCAAAGLALSRVVAVAAVLPWVPALGALAPAAPDEPLRLVPLHVLPSVRTVGFTELAPATAGIAFTNLLADERSLTNQVLLNGSGVAAGDVDGDGLCDLYFCGLDSPNALYRNLGNWRFEEITRRAGVACADQASTGAVLADLDGDGDLDLLVNGLAHGTRLFLNDGHGRFTEGTDAAGLRNSRGSSSLALADVDGDGRLDLYVVNYRNDTLRDLPDTRFRIGTTNGVQRVLSVNGRPADSPGLLGRYVLDGAGGILENGEPDQLFLNRGDARFEVAPWNSPRFLDDQGRPHATPDDWGLSAQFHDLNGDGAPDLYVCNDFQSPDRLWLNDGRGNFRAASTAALSQTSLFSMGVDVADLDRDGHPDFFVADMLSREHARRMVQGMDHIASGQYRHHLGPRPQLPRNTLFHGRADGTFEELANAAGLDASDWSWCPVFLDVDLDGYEDLLVTTGHWRDAQHMDVARELDEELRRRPRPPREQLQLRRRFPRLDTPNRAFRNRGDLTFEETSQAWGFASTRVSHGMALADLDRDGDLDAVVNCLNAPPILARNDATRPRLAIRLRGAPPNTQGIGARIHVEAPGLPAQSQEVIAGGRYLSGDDPLQTFAAPAGEQTATVTVVWRNGRRSRATGIRGNTLAEIREPSSLAPVDAPPAAPPPAPSLLAEFPHRLDHLDSGGPRADSDATPLLPHAPDGQGPAIAWFDFSGDGLEDLLLGTSRGGRPRAYRQQRDGTFVPQKAPLFDRTHAVELGAILGFRSRPDTTVMAVAEAEPDPAQGPSAVARIRLLSLVDGSVTDLPATGQRGGFGPLAAADVDLDGDLDLLAGARSPVTRYPSGGTSVLFRNDDGRFHAVTNLPPAIALAGHVTAALFADLDTNGAPDLVLATEWGALRLATNTLGTLSFWDPPVTLPGSEADRREWPLSELTGWWTAVAAGDFDGDGRTDLACGNWGRNTPRHPTPAAPMDLWFGDADGSGRFAWLESFREAGTGRRLPFRDLTLLGRAFPGLVARFSTHEAFSQATIEDLLQADLPSLEHRTLAILDSVVLLNRGDRFELLPLPDEAQRSPVFGLAAVDLDGDGHTDLVVSQNTRGLPRAEGFHDAGLGLWLRGDGRGALAAVPPEESGIRWTGEGRAVAAADLDQDGRPEVLATFFGGTTRLMRNQRGAAALRVRLRGTSANPDAIGARVRPMDDRGVAGAVQEVSAGSGRLAQSPPTVLLGHASRWRRLRVDWPGGRTTSHELPTPPPATILTVSHPEADHAR